MGHRPGDAVYPVTDVALVCLVLLVLIRSVGQPRPDLILIGLCFATYAVADNGYALLTVRGQDSLGTVVDLGFTLPRVQADEHEPITPSAVDTTRV